VKATEQQEAGTEGVASKQAAEEGGVKGEGVKEEVPGQRRDLLVKWRGRAYIHCTWVPEAVVMSAANKVSQRLHRATLHAGLRQGRHVDEGLHPHMGRGCPHGISSGLREP
jgi:hypothetical protein